MLSGDFHSSDFMFWPFSSSTGTFWLLPLHMAPVWSRSHHVKTGLEYSYSCFYHAFPVLLEYPISIWVPPADSKIAGILCLCLVSDSPPCWRWLHASIYGLIRHRLNPASDLCLPDLLSLMPFAGSTASLALHEGLGLKAIFLVNECERKQNQRGKAVECIQSWKNWICF